MVDEFLKTDCTHMLFIDADIQFSAQDVVTLLASGKEVIGGPYPKKAINWENIAEAVKRDPDTPPSELARLVGKFVFNPVAGTTSIAIGEPLEVLEIGTGFMLIKREVFDKMMVAYPQLKFKPDYIGQPDFNPDRYIRIFFDTVVDTVDSVTGGGSDRYLSEDYFFCQIFRKMGGKIYLCPWMQTRHIGTYDFHGDMPFLAQKIGKL